jgi:molybdenum cofactor cytidylyltransferase
MKPHALVLAAGKARRFGGDKLLYPLADNRCLLDRCIGNLQAARIDFSVVVSADNHAVQQHCHNGGYECVVHPNAERGMGSSIACGVKSQAKNNAWLILPADMPAVAATTITAVATALQHGKHIVAPRYQQQQGHPVGFSSLLYEELIQLDGDHGARAILQAHPELLQLIDVTDPGILLDVDTPEALQALLL